MNTLINTPINTTINYDDDDNINNIVPFKILFVENKQNKYHYETYRVDKYKINEYGKLFDESIINKLNLNINYTAQDIYTLFEMKTIKCNDLFEYLEYRDVFNNYTEWIIMLKKIFNLLDIKDYTSIVKKTNIGVCLNLKHENDDESDSNDNSDNDDNDNTSDNDEINIKKLHDNLIDIFSEIGIIIKDKSNKFINPSFFRIFGVGGNYNMKNINNVNMINQPYESHNIIKTKKDINFNEFFSGKSNGRIIRYLKIYKMIPIKDNYDKNDFKKELIDTGFVEIKKNNIYYKKDCLDDLKEWISEKILK